MRYRVGQSPIHGRGCFAIEPIPAGDLVGVMDLKPVVGDGAYVVWFTGYGDGVDGVGWRVVCSLRYLNHAGTAANVSVTYAQHGRAEVRALRQIEAGEELTMDYGPGWEDLS